MGDFPGVAAGSSRPGVETDEAALGDLIAAAYADIRRRLKQLDTDSS
jgi:hypothetical protein